MNSRQPAHLDSRDVARQARRSALVMCSRANASHIGSALSCIDILAVLYAGVANISPELIRHPNRDVILVSKGHAAAGLYAVLAECGFIAPDELASYCGDGAVLGGHITASAPGVELSTGSLGHALAFGAGIALSRVRTNDLGRVFVVMSDGECDEGATWETAMFAAHHQLGGLTAIMDRNGLQSLGTTEDTLRLEPLADKWRTFGWAVSEIDGHDHGALRDSLLEQHNEPHIVIASTVKGRGVSFMEGSVLWHYRSPQGDDLINALREIDEESNA